MAEAVLRNGTPFVSPGGGAMRIVFVMDGLGTGGAQRSLAETLPYFVKGGIDPIIVCLDHKSEGVERDLLAQGYDIRFLRNRDYFRATRELRRILIGERPAIVHSMLFQADLVTRLAAIGLTVPVMSSLVNMHYGRERLEDAAVRRTRLKVVTMVDGFTARHLVYHFHAVSHAVKRQAADVLRLPEARISVVERSRDLARLGEPTAARRHAVRSVLGLPDDAKVLIAVGRQEFSKGHEYAVQAFDQLAASRPDLLLIIAGRTGLCTPTLETMRQASVAPERIRFLGHRDDVPDLLAAADIFVFPSLYEGIPGAMLEAMALGLPIVASDIPPVREVLHGQPCAVLVPPKSWKAIGEAVASLLDAPNEALALGTTARAVFLEHFQHQQAIDRMLLLYHSVATGATAKGSGSLSQLVR